MQVPERGTIQEAGEGGTGRREACRKGQLGKGAVEKGGIEQSRFVRQ